MREGALARPRLTYLREREDLVVDGQATGPGVLDHAAVGRRLDLARDARHSHHRRLELAL